MSSLRFSELLIAAAFQKSNLSRSHLTLYCASLGAVPE